MRCYSRRGIVKNNKFAYGVVVLLGLVLSGCGGGGSGGDEPGGDEPGGRPMTFTVTVPLNTPVEENVFLVSGPFKIYPMDKIGERTWVVELKEEDLKDDFGRVGDDSKPAAFDFGTQEFWYAFSHSQDYLGGEFLPGDPTQEEWWVFRSVKFSPGNTQVDTVERWRWFPPDGETVPAYPATLTAWQSRVDNSEFEAGVFFADVWHDNQHLVTHPTNIAAKQNAKATWVQIAPPWDYTQLDPVPVMSNVGVQIPSYKDEQSLRGHIRQIKADGLKVTLEPQVCCVSLGDTSLRDDTWKMAWFDEYEKFLLYHARIAEEEGVDKLLLDWSSNNVIPVIQANSQYEARWRDLMAKVKNLYSGPIGYSVLLLGNVGSYNAPGPKSGQESIKDLFDFWGLHFWQGLASTNLASQSDLDNEVELVFVNSIDPVYASDLKPITLASIAYGSFDGSAIGDKGVYEVAVESYFQEGATVLEYDGIEQAMIIQAIMKAIAKRPYIVGAYPFLYQYVAQPLSPDYSIRAKPAEGTISEWYSLATQ